MKPASQLRFPGIPNPVLALRLGLSWIVFFAGQFLIYSRATGAALPLLIVFLGLRWGVDRCKCGEPPLIRTALSSLLAVCCVLLVFSSYGSSLAASRRVEVAFFVVIGFMCTLGVCRDCLVATGRIIPAPQPPRSRV